MFLLDNCVAVDPPDLAHSRLSLRTLLYSNISVTASAINLKVRLIALFATKIYVKPKLLFREIELNGWHSQ